MSRSKSVVTVSAMVVVGLLVVVSAALALSPASGVFKGKLPYTLGNGTHQTGKIAITVASHRRIARLVMNGTIMGGTHSTGLSCGAVNFYDSSQKGYKAKISHARIAHNGSFSTTFIQGRDKVVLTGRFTSAHRVSGTVRETLPDPVQGECDSGHLKFRARH